jgi:hypothetical protein
LEEVVFWHLPNPDLYIGQPDGETWFITPENAFPLLQSPMAASFTPLQPTLDIVHCDLRLGCSAMKTHFVKLPTNSSCADVGSSGSLAFCSECCNWGETIFTRYMLQHSAVPLCELVWPTTSRLSRCCSKTFLLHNNSTYSWPGQL